MLELNQTAHEDLVTFVMVKQQVGWHMQFKVNVHYMGIDDYVYTKSAILKNKEQSANYFLH